jgi:hypothetical protein
MDGAHRRRALAHSGRHSLDRARAHIAYCKQPWMARLERERQAAQGLPSRVQALCAQETGR